MKITTRAETPAFAPIEVVIRVGSQEDLDRLQRVAMQTSKAPYASLRSFGAELRAALTGC